jgi:hypothetical protein
MRSWISIPLPFEVNVQYGLLCLKQALSTAPWHIARIKYASQGSNVPADPRSGPVPNGKHGSRCLTRIPLCLMCYPRWMKGGTEQVPFREA